MTWYVGPLLLMSQEGYFVEAGAVNGVLDSNTLVNIFHILWSGAEMFAKKQILTNHPSAFRAPIQLDWAAGRSQSC